MKILITGIAGFVGNHLVEHLKDSGFDGGLEIMGIDVNLDNFHYRNKNIPGVKIKTSKIDLRDKEEVTGLVGSFKPDIIYHLAAQSSVGYSWKKPVETFEINVFGGINILESVKECCPSCRILVVCTAEEYGRQKKGVDKPIDEDFKIQPTNPYAISKSALDFFSTIYQKTSELLIFVSRSFNHIGPGQSDRFVISDFAKQIAEIEKGIQDPVILVGNINVYRDFLDVRDVISAYGCIINNGKPGEVYNVCSGKRSKISDILDMLLSYSSVKNIKVKVDKNKLRPIDLYSVYGNNKKLILDTGWKQNYNIKTSLLDTLKWWRKKKGVI